MSGEGSFADAARADTPARAYRHQEVTGGDLVFAVGDLVCWASCTGGVWRHHVGVVVAVVPARGNPYQHMPAGSWSTHFRDSATRAAPSYLVALKGAGRVGQLHRPRVHHLRHYGDEADPILEVRRRSRKGNRPGLDRAAAMPVPVVRVTLGPVVHRLANGATWHRRPESRDLVVYRRRLSRRDLCIAAAAAPVFATLFWLLVTGLQQLVPT